MLSDKYTTPNGCEVTRTVSDEGETITLETAIALRLEIARDTHLERAQVRNWTRYQSRVANHAQRR